MIQERQQMQVTSTLDAPSIAMTIDESAMAHIMSILTDLYSDPEAAVLREISTNALDAHVEAGVKRPIEVTLPSSLSPFLKIRDYGVGMSVEDIHSTFSKYGASTKRGTNDQVGMLGLGCKSPLTYCAQFTISSCRDTTRITVAVGRDEDGSGSMKVVDTRSDFDGDGTEVTIPAKRDNNFVKLAADFFQYWDEGTVLVNGSAPTRFEGLDLGNGIWTQVAQVDPYRHRSYYGQRAASKSKIVMGNVAYPWPTQIDDPSPDAVNLIAFVPIGTVAFAPSREALMWTKQTRETCEKIVLDYNAAVEAAIQKKIDDAATPFEAATSLVEWSGRLGKSGGQFTYQGKPLPTSFDTPNGAARFEVSPVNAHRLGGSSVMNSIPLESWPSTVWVTDFAPGTYTASHKRKSNQYCEGKGITNHRQYVMLPSSRAIPADVKRYLDPKKIVSWNTVKLEKLTTTQANGYATPRLKGSYDIRIDHPHNRQDGVAADKLPKDNLFWIHASKYGGQREAKFLETHVGSFTLVLLPKGRIDKFKRDFPHAEHYDAAYTRIADSWMDTLSTDQKDALKIGWGGIGNSLTSLPASGLNDPDLIRSRRLAMLDKDGSLYNKWVALGCPNIDSKWTNPLEKYPLLPAYGLRYERGKTKDHIVWYINAAYAARTEDA